MYFRLQSLALVWLMQLFPTHNSTVRTRLPVSFHFSSLKMTFEEPLPSYTELLRAKTLVTWSGPCPLLFTARKMQACLKQKLSIL